MAAVRVFFAPEAAQEVEAAKEWYAERSVLAALVFADEVAAAIQRILESPGRWPKHVAGTRRHALHRFPFVIIYREKRGSIQIVAVAHAKRRPGYWKDRLKP